jgi:hypothetical protein
MYRCITTSTDGFQQVGRYAEVTSKQAAKALRALQTTLDQMKTAERVPPPPLPAPRSIFDVEDGQNIEPEAARAAFYGTPNDAATTHALGRFLRRQWFARQRSSHYVVCCTQCFQQNMPTAEECTIGILEGVCEFCGASVTAETARTPRRELTAPTSVIPDPSDVGPAKPSDA